MKINEIRVIVEKMCVIPSAMDKKQLVRSIQKKEGNTPCFKTGQPFCDQNDCCWRSDCKPGALKAKSS